MSYADLYARFVGKTEYFNRNVYTAAVREITGVNRIVHMRTAMDLAVCRGVYLKPSNVDHPFVQSWGGNIVLTARGLNRCWERFVYCKELMHLFSEGDQCADSGDQFEDLMTELSSAQATASGPYRDEIDSFWRALALICPEVRRQEFRRKLEANEISEYDVALQLRIPEMYVSRLFWPVFDDFRKRNGLAD